MGTPANPFHYGSPVTGERFAGRSVELEALVSRMRSHISVVLSSPRRYGKSSLIQQACAELAAGRPEPAVVSVNLLRCGSLANAVSIMLRGLYLAPGGRWHRFRQALPAFVHRLRAAPSVQFGADGTPSFTLGPSLAAQDAELLVSDIFAALGEIGATRPAVLVLDEFQAVGDIHPHLPSLLKALADEYPRVSLLLAGSKHHLMESLVLNKDAPLYDMCQTLALGPIPDEDWIPFLQARARAGRKPLIGPEAAQRILELAGPVPYDIQQLAYESYLRAQGSIGVAEAEAGLTQLVEHEVANYSERLESLSPGQRRVLAAMVDARAPSIGSQAFASAAGLSNPTSVRKAMTSLAEAEVVVRRSSRWEIDDPFFAAWLRAGGM